MNKRFARLSFVSEVGVARVGSSGLAFSNNNNN